MMYSKKSIAQEIGVSPETFRQLLIRLRKDYGFETGKAKFLTAGGAGFYHG